MAKKHFIVLEDSFIGMRLIKADAPLTERVVELEVDVDKGGMTPSSNLAPAVMNEGTGQWEIEVVKPAKTEGGTAPTAEDLA